MIFLNRGSRYPDIICVKKNLKVNRILTSTGSQCRLFNIAVIWSELRAPVIIRATVFGIHCNLSLWYFGMSYNLKRLLQYSSLESIKEGTFESYGISGFLAHFVYVFSK